MGEGETESEGVRVRVVGTVIGRYTYVFSGFTFLRVHISQGLLFIFFFIFFFYIILSLSGNSGRPF